MAAAVGGVSGELGGVMGRCGPSSGGPCCVRGAPGLPFVLVIATLGAGVSAGPCRGGTWRRAAGVAGPALSRVRV